MEKVKIGILGLGAISGIYLKNLSSVFRNVEILAIYDLIEEKAEKVQEEYHIPKVYKSMEEMLDDPKIEIVLNLTRPLEHYHVTKAALLAGKHVYSEKPLATTFEEGQELLTLAKERNLLLGGAPDTFLGAGIQTCKKIIDSGFIGRPIGAAAFMICHGHESWHPAPEFYYQTGGGPMMDMGPYYLTALVNLMGSVKGLTGIAKKNFAQRLITSEPLYGKIIDVEVPTHYNGILDFENGATATITTTFDVHYTQQARFEVYGTEGTLIVPDPNTFGGPVKHLSGKENEYKEMPLLFDYSENSRGLGLSNMADALRGIGDFRANGDQMLHVLEIMTGFEKSSNAGSYLELATRLS